MRPGAEFGVLCWGFVGLSLHFVCLCSSKAKLLNSDFSFFLSHTSLLPPLPDPISPLPLCLSELEGEAGSSSEEGKKGFSFSVSSLLVLTVGTVAQSRLPLFAPAAFPCAGP